MSKLENLLRSYPERVFFVFLILALPSFFFNLGLLPLFADEPTRANVSLEMILSQNFSVPTIGGEFYYNKPPMYNWLLALVYTLTGSFSEFATRLPAIVPMFLFTISIFFSVRYFLKDQKVAALSGLLFLVNGRMLIYDSMLSHIDIFYSWLTFSSFMLIFYFFEKKRWFLLFFCSYLITAITFLCKGMPSVVFQGFTLIALLAYTSNLKKLFSWQHILSGLICLLIIAAYFYNYSLYNSHLEEYFYTLWDQSLQRTPARFNLGQTIIHVISFPFEQLGHLFPASLLLLFCFHKNFIEGVKSHPFLKYITIIFLANIWIYWLSPQTRPRYIIMLYPLLFIIWSHAYYTYRDRLPRLNKVFETSLLVLALLVILAIPAVFFFDLQSYVPFLSLKALIVFLGCAFFSYLIVRLRSSKILAFVGLLLMVRLGFSFFVLPHRLQHTTNDYYRQAAIEMGNISKGQPFYFYQYHPHELAIPFHDRLIFYIQRTRMEKVNFTEVKVKPGYYFTFDRDINDPDAILIKTYQNLKFYKVK